MRWLRAFFTQPNRAYRDFQIAFTILTANFFFPAVSYVFDPDQVLGVIDGIGQLFGADPYTVPESASRLWRYLGAANVMTLAFMCLLLQVDLLRFYAVLIPLTFLKAYNAFLFLGDYLFNGFHPAFLVVALFDLVTSVAFVFFARRAHRAVQSRPELELVPAPRSRQ